MGQKYLTFDCYGTLLNEEPTYNSIETIANKIGVDSKLARTRFINYQDDRNNMHPYIDYAILTRNNLIHLDYQFGLEHQFEKHYVDVLIAHRSLTPFTEVIATLQKFIDHDVYFPTNIVQESLEPYYLKHYISNLQDVLEKIERNY